MLVLQVPLFNEVAYGVYRAHTTVSQVVIPSKREESHTHCMCGFVAMRHTVELSTLTAGRTGCNAHARARVKHQGAPRGVTGWEWGVPDT
eukprot:3952956-Prymnesium_polylepis.1